MFKKIISVLIIFFFALPALAAGESYTLKSGISIIDRVPKDLFGTWRVESALVSTNSEEIFKKSTIDFWNLSRHVDVITLDNPFSGAKASITVNEVSGKLIKFKKLGDYDGKKLTDIVQLKLEKDTFTGTNTIILETLSNVDNSVIKTERATYRLRGEKISGSSIK